MAQDWEVLEIVGTEEEAELIVGFLASNGIPSQMDSAHSHEFPVNAGDIRVEVPAGRLQEARQLLASRQDALGADVDMVGEPQAGEDEGTV